MGSLLTLPKPIIRPDNWSIGLFSSRFQCLCMVDIHLPSRIGLHGCFLVALRYGGVPIGTGLRLWGLLKETEQGRLFLRPLHPVSLKKYYYYLPVVFCKYFSPREQCRHCLQLPASAVSGNQLHRSRSSALLRDPPPLESTALHCDVDEPTRQLSVVGSVAKFVMTSFVCRCLS